MNSAKLFDEIHESFAAPEEPELRRERKEAVARNIVIHVNDHSGQQRMS
jgi:hypothetical protein